MRVCGPPACHLAPLDAFLDQGAAIENPSRRPGEREGAGSRRRLLLPFVVFAVCALAYSLLHLAFIGSDIANRTDGDEVQYLVVTESIIKDHDLSPLNQYAEKVYLEHGYYGTDIAYPSLVPGYGGRLVYSHIPAMSFLLVPGFWLFGYHGAAATMIVLTALAAALLFAVLRRFAREKVALAGTLVFFLTYPLATYSRLLYTETVMVFLLPFTMWACLRLSETRRVFYAVLAGASAGLMLQFHVKYAALTAASFILLIACSKDRRRDLAAWAVPWRPRSRYLSASLSTSTALTSFTA